MFCPYCGHDIPDGPKRCPICGASTRPPRKRKPRKSRRGLLWCALGLILALGVVLAAFLWPRSTPTVQATATPASTSPALVYWGADHALHCLDAAGGQTRVSPLPEYLRYGASFSALLPGGRLLAATEEGDLILYNEDGSAVSVAEDTSLSILYPVQFFSQDAVLIYQKPYGTFYRLDASTPDVYSELLAEGVESAQFLADGSGYYQKDGAFYRRTPQGEHILMGRELSLLSYSQDLTCFYFSRRSEPEEFSAYELVEDPEPHDPAYDPLRRTLQNTFSTRSYDTLYYFDGRTLRQVADRLYTTVLTDADSGLALYRPRLPWEETDKPLLTDFSADDFLQDLQNWYHAVLFRAETVEWRFTVQDGPEGTFSGPAALSLCAAAPERLFCMDLQSSSLLTCSLAHPELTLLAEQAEYLYALKEEKFYFYSYTAPDTLPSLFCYDLSRDTVTQLLTALQPGSVRLYADGALLYRDAGGWTVLCQNGRHTPIARQDRVYRLTDGQILYTANQNLYLLSTPDAPPLRLAQGVEELWLRDEEPPILQL